MGKADRIMASNSNYLIQHRMQVKHLLALGFNINLKVKSIILPLSLTIALKLV